MPARITREPPTLGPLTTLNLFYLAPEQVLSHVLIFCLNVTHLSRLTLWLCGRRRQIVEETFVGVYPIGLPGYTGS